MRFSFFSLRCCNWIAAFSSFFLFIISSSSSLV
jgi:hypothetical protein